MDMISLNWTVPGMYLLRLAVALICGALVGLERQRRRKKPGIRTHMIVALASACMMMVSKYAFLDMAELGLTADPGRIAASVVTSIGFLGAGAIFFRKQTVIGLTSAAGLWATMGIGLSIGAGLYFLGGAATVFILLLQTLMRSDAVGRAHLEEYDLVFRIDNTPEALEQLRTFFRERRWEVIRFKAEKRDDKLVVDACIGFSGKHSAEEILALLQNEHISAVEY